MRRAGAPKGTFVQHLQPVFDERAPTVGSDSRARPPEPRRNVETRNGSRPSRPEVRARQDVEPVVRPNGSNLGSGMRLTPLPQLRSTRRSRLHGSLRHSRAATPRRCRPRTKLGSSISGARCRPRAHLETQATLEDQAEKVNPPAKAKPTFDNPSTFRRQMLLERLSLLPLRYLREPATDLEPQVRSGFAACVHGVSRLR